MLKEMDAENMERFDIGASQESQKVPNSDQDNEGEEMS